MAVRFSSSALAATSNELPDNAVGSGIALGPMHARQGADALLDAQMVEILEQALDLQVYDLHLVSILAPLESPPSKP
jgi:hypothetical protein